MSYESDIESGAFTPSDEALAVDKYIASTSPETHPDEYTFLGTLGYAYTGPMGMKSSRSEHTAWVNSGLGASGFGGSFTDIYDDPDEDETFPIQPLPMCDDPRAINYGESGICKFPPATEDPGTPADDTPAPPADGTTTGAPPFVNIGSPVGGAFTGMAPQRLSYSATALPSTAPAPSVKNVDYVKLLRGWLTNSLFKDMI